MGELSLRNDVFESEKRQELEIARRQELEPILAVVAIQAIHTFDLIRPLARPAGTVPNNYPLRSKTTESRDGDKVADYLMLAFGQDHDLVIYRNFTSHNNKLEITRTTLLGTMANRQTKIVQLREPRELDGGVMDIEVANYCSSQQYDRNGLREGYLCSPENIFSGATRYIKEVEDDLTKATKQYL